MKPRIVILSIALVIIGLGVYFLYPRIVHPVPDEANPAQIPERMTSVPNPNDIYQCPMHPQIISDKPGVCRICGMTLVKRAEHFSDSNHGTAGKSVSLTPEKQVLANVSTVQARRMSLEKEIRAGGIIAFAEPAFHPITIRFPGRVENLHISYTGQRVNAGDAVADVYSPEAVSAQQEFLLAKESYAQVKDSPELISGGALSLMEQSRHKLVLWGFTEEQLSRLDSTHTVQTIVTIFSPVGGVVLKKNVNPQQYVTAGEELFEVANLSTLWVYADVYEFEMESVHIGDPVKTLSDAYPGESFNGKINFISPTVDPASRTVRIRADIYNFHEKLKPDMFVSVILKVRLPSTVVLPPGAVLSTGDRTVVWIQKEKNIFVPRLVTLGARTAEYVQILDGVGEGEIVVASGGYLIDSESQLVGASSVSPENKQ